MIDTIKMGTALKLDNTLSAWEQGLITCEELKSNVMEIAEESGRLIAMVTEYAIRD